MKKDKKYKNIKINDVFFISLIIVVAILSLLLFAYLRTFRQLPSCYYGCDYINHLGTMQHLIQGGSYFENAQIGYGMPWTPQLYHILVVMFSKIMRLGIIKAQLYFSIIIYILSAILFYVFVTNMFKKKFIGIIIALILFNTVPVLKYREFTYTLTLPLFFYFSYKLFKYKKIINSILLGISYGLVANSHVAGFIVATIFMAVMIVEEFINKFREEDRNNITNMKEFFKYIIKFSREKEILYWVCSFIIGSAIGLIYWWWPIYKKFHILNPSNEYGAYDMSSLKMKIYVLKKVLNIFFYHGDLFSIVFQILYATGLIILLMNLISRKVYKKYGQYRKKEIHFIMLLVITTLIVSFHYFLTEPLIGKSVFPYMLAKFIFFTTSILLASLSLDFIISIYASESTSKRTKHIYVIIILLVMLFSIGSVYHIKKYDTTNPYIDIAKSPMNPYFVQLQKWILENTNLNDVFLTTKESCFMLNGLTGRKCMIYRITHMDLYTDPFQPQADAAIILYGNNSELRKKLIANYGLDYLYWDINWYGTEFVFNDGKIVALFDPIEIPYSEKYAKYLSRNGVKYMVVDAYLDPAAKPGFKTYKVIIPLPNTSTQQPWKEDLNNYMQPVWGVKVNNTLIGVIYKFKDIDIEKNKK